VYNPGIEENEISGTVCILETQLIEQLKYELSPLLRFCAAEIMKLILLQADRCSDGTQGPHKLAHFASGDLSGDFRSGDAVTDTHSRHSFLRHRHVAIRPGASQHVVHGALIIYSGHLGAQFRVGIVGRNIVVVIVQIRQITGN